MDIFSKYFTEYLSLYPSFSSFLGNRESDNDFENFLDRSHNIKYGKLMSKYSKILKDYNRSSDIDIKMLKWVVKDNIEGMKYAFDLFPISSHENSVIDFTFINKTMYPLKDVKDLKNLMKRHMKFIEFIDRAIMKMKIGMKRKIVLPRIICAKVVEALTEFVNTQGYFIKLPESILNAPSNKETVQKYESFMHTTYFNAVRRIYIFMKNIYIKKCRDTIGLSNIPGGKNMYKYLLKSFTTLRLSPEYVHNLGIKEVSRISKEMHDVKDKLGFKDIDELQSFYKTMLTDKDNFFKTDGKLMSEYKDVLTYVNKRVIPKNFKQDVDDYLIKRIPKSLEKTSAGAFYYPGSVTNTYRKGTFYINMRDLKENPKYSTMTLSLHEGKPGHHYQFQYMIEKKLPLHRMYGINGTAFVEGWALYAESLGNYKNKPYDYFGKLTYELFRAVRLVVDTGIHYYDWSFKDAVNYMVKHLAMSESEIVTEVERYICMPAQAVCYKIGERKIHSLRTRFLNSIGNTPSNLKEFHELVLEDGVIPLALIEQKIKKKISQKLKSAKGLGHGQSRKTL
jgi:uncharacterized protein (DUF885 family)